MKRKIRLAQPLILEWDEGNIDKNVIRHNVSNRETEEIFFNDPVIMPDRTHSHTEERHFAFGITNKERLLIASFTLRGTQQEIIRPIMCRDMNKKEKGYYLSQKQKSEVKKAK